MASAVEKRNATCSVVSHSLAAPSSHAVAFRLSPELKQQLLRSHKSGEGCHLQLSADGSGACLRLGTKMVQLRSKPVVDTEAISIPAAGGTIQSAFVRAKLAPAPGRAGRAQTSLAAKAHQLEQDPQRVSPSGAAARRPSPPLPAARTTAPQRTSLSFRQPSHAKPEKTRAALAPSAQPKASTGRPASAIEIQTAFATGGLRMLLSAVLCEKPLPKGTLTKKVEDAFRAAGGKPPSFKGEVQPELRHVAEYRSPGVYALLPYPRTEFEKVRGSAVQHNKHDTTKTQPKQRQKAAAVAQQANAWAKPSNRAWTKELLSGRNELAAAKPPQQATPDTLDTPAASAELEVTRGRGRKKTSALTLKEKRDALQAAPSTPSTESNATRVRALGSSPEQEVHAPPRASEKPPLKRPAAGPANEARKKPRSSGSREAQEADLAWYKEHLGREPALAGTISSREQFEKVSCEYKSKYSVYHRLHQEIQEAKRLSKLFASSASSESDGVGKGLRRVWAMKQKQLPEMQQAYRCLHAELASLKGAGQAFASTY